MYCRKFLFLCYSKHSNQYSLISVSTNSKSNLSTQFYTFLWKTGTSFSLLSKFMSLFIFKKRKQLLWWSNGEIVKKIAHSFTIWYQFHIYWLNSLNITYTSPPLYKIYTLEPLFIKFIVILLRLIFWQSFFNWTNSILFLINDIYI